MKKMMQIVKIGLQFVNYTDFLSKICLISIARVDDLRLLFTGFAQILSFSVPYPEEKTYFCH